MRSAPKRLLALLVLPSLVLSSIATGVMTSASAAPKTSSGFSVTIKAADGTFTLHSRPKAIVSLSPTSTEMLYAIGAGPQVKAVDSDSNYPKNAPITKLSAYTPSVEAIAKYKPDLVVVALDNASFNSQMAALKIPVIYFSAAANLAQAYHEYAVLGHATGNAVGAQKEVARLKAKIAHIVSSTPKAPAGSTYYYELDPTYYSVTSSTFVGQLLGLLGLKSIADSATGAASSGGYPQLNAEFILKANPTYIFLADTICCQASASTVGARAGWSALSAVQNGQIIGLSDDIASRWGPRVTVLLQEAANALKATKVPPAS